MHVPLQRLLATERERPLQQRLLVLLLAAAVLLLLPHLVGWLDPVLGGEVLLEVLAVVGIALAVPLVVRVLLPLVRVGQVRVPPRGRVVLLLLLAASAAAAAAARCCGCGCGGALG